MTIPSLFRVAVLLLAGWTSGISAQVAPPGTGRPAQHRTDPGTHGLELGDVLRRATSQHPLVAAARSRVAAARGARLTARTLPNPVFTYWVENLALPGRNTTVALDREIQTSATLPLEPLFQRWPRVRGAEEHLRAADADYIRARQLVALDAARAFHRVAAAQVAVDAAEEIRARLAELVTFNRARVDEGVAAEADLIRTQLELERFAATVTLERVELARSRAELAPYLAGRSAATTPDESNRAEAARIDTLWVAIDDTATTAARDSLPALAWFVTHARTTRPDLSALRARAAAARAEVGYQRALTFRQIGATVGTKRTLGVRSLMAGVSLPIPLFDQNRGDVQRASGERAAAEQEAVWAERQVAAEVEAAYEAARLLTERADALRGTFLERAEESRRIALAAYQEGAGSLLQLLDASRTLADARLIYYRTLFAQRQGVLELKAAVGINPTDGFLPPTTARPRRPSGDRP